MYLVASNHAQLHLRETTYIGRRCAGCSGSGHMLYFLPLAEAEVDAFRATPWSKPNCSGRKTLRLSDGAEIFVSLNPTCRWAGVRSLAPRATGKTEDASPQPLTSAQLDAAASAAVAPDQSTHDSTISNDDDVESESPSSSEAARPNARTPDYGPCARPENYVTFWRDMLNAQLTVAREHGVNSAHGLHAYAAKKCLNEPLWKLTEVDGKYWCRYFSKDAWIWVQKLNRLPNQYGAWPEDASAPRCQHEHVVERQHLLWQVFAGKLRLDDLDKFLVACVITREEHARLDPVPVETLLSAPDLWRRYREADVDVYDRKERRWLGFRQGATSGTLPP